MQSLRHFLNHWIQSKRKIIHFGLLATVIVLQLVVVIFWWMAHEQESKRAKAFEQLAELQEVERLSDELLAAIRIGQDSKHSDHEAATAQIEKIKTLLNRMRRVYTQNSKGTAPTSLENLNQWVETASPGTWQPNWEPFDYKELTESVKVDSIISKDKVKRKGLLARLGDAISGKINVQKEQLKIIISYRTDEGIKHGTVKEIMDRILKAAVAHYEKQRANVNPSFGGNTTGKTRDLSALTLAFLSDYEALLGQKITAKNNIILQMERDHAVLQRYLIVGLILLSLLISLILYRFTVRAFKFQNRIETARRQIQENLNFKNRLISLLSHEVRSPLGSIVLYSKSVQQTVNDPEIQDTFNSIQYNANSLLVLTNQILNTLRNEKEVTHLESVPFLLDYEIKMMGQSLTPLAENKGNRLVNVRRIPEDLVVVADRVKLGQLYFNLIGNAIRFTENGTIEVFSAVKADRNPNYYWLRVYIRDNGMGMQKSLLESVLDDSFYQNNQFKINQISTGLGIHLCREILYKMQGRFYIKSAPEVGTQLFFTLRIAKG